MCLLLHMKNQVFVTIAELTLWLDQFKLLLSATFGFLFLSDLNPIHI